MFVKVAITKAGEISRSLENFKRGNRSNLDLKIAEM